MGITLVGTNLYRVKEDAEGVALQLGISGAHQVECEGELWWRPGVDEKMFNDRLFGPKQFPGKSYAEFRQSLAWNAGEGSERIH